MCLVLTENSHSRAGVKDQRRQWVCLVVVVGRQSMAHKRQRIVIGSNNSSVATEQLSQLVE